MASPRAPPAPLAKHTEVPGFRADKGVDIRATAAQRRTSGAGLFAGIGPADDPKSPAAAPSPRAPLPPRGPTPSKASTLPSPSPAPAPATAGAKAPNAKSNTASPSKPAHTGRILGPPPQKDSSWFSCCRSSDVDEAATAATEEEAKAANHEGPQEDQPAAKTKAPAPKKSSADDDDASPAKSSVSAMAKLDESKLVRKQSVLNQPDKPPTPSTAAARSASFRGNPLSLSGSLGPASNPASPSALEATDRPSPAGGIRRLSSKATLQQQQTSSSEGGIRRAPSFSSASPGVSPASGVDATPSPTALRSDNGDLVKQVSLVARKSSFVMPSAQQSALPPRPSPSSQGASNDNAPPPLKGLGARPSSASGELQKSKKSSIVSGVSGASPSPPRDDATTSPGIGRARGGSTAGDVVGEGSSVLSMSASLGRAPRPPRPLNV